MDFHTFRTAYPCSCCLRPAPFNYFVGQYWQKCVLDTIPVKNGASVVSYDIAATITYMSNVPRPPVTRLPAERYSCIAIGDDNHHGIDGEWADWPAENWCAVIDELSSLSVVFDQVLPQNIGASEYINPTSIVNTYLLTATTTSEFTADFSWDSKQYRITVPAGLELESRRIWNANEDTYDDEDYLVRTAWYIGFDIPVYANYIRVK